MSGTDEYTSEEGKQKRKMSQTVEREDQIFGKSPLISRSPPRNKKMAIAHSEIERLTEMMSKLMEEFKEIRKENAEYKNELRELKREQEESKEEMKKIKEKLSILEEENWRREKDDRRKRKNNITIEGLRLENCEGDQLQRKVNEFLTTNLKVQQHRAEVTKISDKMCIVKTNRFEIKMEIMKNKHLLRNIKDRRIYIDDDLTHDERRIQKIIRDRAREERGKGNKVKVGYQKIIIGEEKWIWSRELKDLQKAARETKN